jgi:hypothetical protein
MDNVMNQHFNLRNSIYSSSVFFWLTFAKYQPEKYNFNLNKGFFMEIMTQIRQISKKTKSKSPDFYGNFQ